jgi:hypothetical protein
MHPRCVRSEADVRRVFELWELGWSKAAIARTTGVSRAQVRSWIEVGIDAVLASPMRAGHSHAAPHDCELRERVDGRAYAYLLGQYLGDGCLSHHPRGVAKLRIFTCDDYPDIRSECIAAIQTVMPGRKVGLVRRVGCHEVYCFSKHWPCLFPQDGPGRKHERHIALEPWQSRIALDQHAALLLRGLIHSDGWRGINVAVIHRGVEVRRYRYPRYQFTNESPQIRDLFVQACERVGAECRPSNRNTISVSRRASVELLDGFIGPKT